MKSLTLPIFLGISAILTMSAPLWVQKSEKTVPPHKSCKAMQEEVEVYADFMRGESGSKNITVLVTSTEARDYEVDIRNPQLAAGATGFLLRFALILRPQIGRVV
jgi:hypothetical protein